MRKTLLSLALAGLFMLPAAQAEVILYGRIAAGMEVTKTFKENGQKPKTGSDTELVDYGSNIGFKGSEQLSDRLKMIWRLEQSVPLDGSKDYGFGTRTSYVGLKGDFGTLTVGNQSHPLAYVSGYLDDYEYYNFAGVAWYGRGNDVNKRRVSVMYESPEMVGVTVRASVSPSDNVKIKESRLKEQGDTAVYGLGVGYKKGDFFADVAGGYVKNGSSNRAVRANGKLDHAYEISTQVGYENDDVLLGVGYQIARNVDGCNTITPNADGECLKSQIARSNEVMASAMYRLKNGLRLKGSVAYGFNMKDLNTETQELSPHANNGKYVHGVVGVDYKLSKNTSVNANVGYAKAGKGDRAFAVGAVTAGLVHTF